MNGHILNDCYYIVCIKVDLRFKFSRWLNFYTDESNNIRKERIINFLVHVLSDCDIDEEYFYINFEINGFRIMDAEI